jgi:predicted CxxxxCH...CXXCH cytochrome family protein
MQNAIIAQIAVWCVAGGFIQTPTRNVACGSCSTVGCFTSAVSRAADALLPLVPSPRWGEGYSLLQHEGMGEGVRIHQYRR